MTALRLGSLFDGIGVFPLAAVRCGIEPVWASEIEKAPISITKRHFPDMAHLGDVTKLDGREIPPVHTGQRRSLTITVQRRTNMNELTYIRCGDYYIPDLKLSERPETPIGKYGRMRQRYLKEHRPGLYSSLILSEKLYPHLLEIDRAARERMDAMLPRMMEAAGVTEELKARDPIRWVGLMNTLKAQVEEVIQSELIWQ